MAISQDALATVLRRTLVFATVLAAVLVGAGLLVFPGTLLDWKGTLPGLAGVAAVLGAYAVLGRRGIAHIQREDPRLLRLALWFGVAAGAVYATEILVEYVLLPNDNTPYGYVEFGLVFLAYLLSGFMASVQTRRALSGPKVAIGSALISTLLWYIVLLTTTYVMKGTTQQAAVFRAEGNLDDFAHSGSRNFEAWLMQDFLGAGFYHMILAILIATVLGILGGAIGKLFPRKEEGPATG